MPAAARRLATASSAPSDSIAQRLKWSGLRNLKSESFVASASPYMKVRVSWKARSTFCSPASSSSPSAADAAKTTLSTSSIASRSER